MSTNNQCRKSNRQSEFRSDETVRGSSGGTPEFDCNLMTSEPSRSVCDSDGGRSSISRIAANCYPPAAAAPPPRKRRPCAPAKQWQRGAHVRDECGSGVVPKRLGPKVRQQLWCQTPLSMYQSTIGELAKKILCGEEVVARDINAGPPCNVCEEVLPPCRGYYRKYDCLRPCEEEYATTNAQTGEKRYRNRTTRYWEPCVANDDHAADDPNSFAHQNAFLGAKVRRRNDDGSCW